MVECTTMIPSVRRGFGPCACVQEVGRVENGGRFEHYLCELGLTAATGALSRPSSTLLHCECVLRVFVDM